MTRSTSILTPAVRRAASYLLFLSTIGCANSFALAQDIAIDSSTAGRQSASDTLPFPPSVEPGQAPEGSVGGMGDINLYPKRIVIDRRQRIATVGLYNKTANTGDYEIDVKDMVMTPQGGVYALDNLPEGVSVERLKGAAEMLRWSPRRVALRGSESQTVRIMSRPAADLPDGEYRSHFSVVAIPPQADAGLSIEDAVMGGSSAASGIGVSIKPRFGISIPVIVRVGETTLDVGLRIDGVVEIQSGLALALTVARSGTRSAFGDVLITLEGSSEPVAIARGVGVYPEVDSRDVVIPFSADFDTSQLRSGSILAVSFIDDDVNPGSTLARQDFVVP